MTFLRGTTLTTIFCTAVEGIGLVSRHDDKHGSNRNHIPDNDTIEQHQDEEEVIVVPFDYACSPPPSTSSVSSSSGDKLAVFEQEEDDFMGLLDMLMEDSDGAAASVSTDSEYSCGSSTIATSYLSPLTEPDDDSFDFHEVNMGEQPF